MTDTQTTPGVAELAKMESDLGKDIEAPTQDAIDLEPAHTMVNALSVDKLRLLGEVAVGLSMSDSTFFDDVRLANRFLDIVLGAFSATKGGLFLPAGTEDVVAISARQGRRTVSAKDFSRTRIREALRQGTTIAVMEPGDLAAPASVLLNTPGPTVAVPLLVPGQAERLPFAALCLVRDPGEASFDEDCAFLELVGRLLSPLVHRSQVYQATLKDMEKVKQDVERAREELEHAKADVEIAIEAAILEATASKDPVDRILGNDPALEQARERTRIAARNVKNVLLSGETGTGKELFAHAIHSHPLSPRKGKPFIALNCAGMPDELLESELFGHEPGAFTGADRRKPGLIRSANGGTLFLDEIQSASRVFLNKLLRVVDTKMVRPAGGDAKDERPVDFRLITATNKNLLEEVAADRFPGDIYQRLAQLPINLPPLRDRKEDLPHLVIHFFRLAKHESGRTELRRLAHDALDVLTHYHWPRNVRQLRDVVGQCVMFSKGPEITAADVRAVLREAGADIPSRPALDVRPIKPGETITREHLLSALSASDGQIIGAAKALRVSRQTFYNLLRRHGLEDRAPRTLRRMSNAS